MFKLNIKSILVFIAILSLVISVFYFIKNPKPQSINSSSSTKAESPKIVATKPEPLDDTVIASTEEIEIIFNMSLQNSAELKLRMEPEIDYKVELSGDRKTAKIIPNKPYPLGTTFTLFIGPETKFDEVGRWGEEKVFHFRTIKYSGV